MEEILGRMVFVASILLATSGCVSYDAQTIDAINDRLSRVEAGSSVRGGQPQVNVQGQGWIGKDNYVFIYIRMRNGGMMPIKITQKNTAIFEGPKGELYNGLPTVEQLRNEYAPDTNAQSR